MSITIKQAFQKLAMVTGAALKNPWFIGRNLNQAFADIADNIVDEGGSTIEVEAELTEGTEIGTITVDGDETVLYAPTAPEIPQWTFLGEKTGSSGISIDLDFTELFVIIKYNDYAVSLYILKNEIVNNMEIGSTQYKGSAYFTGTVEFYNQAKSMQIKNCATQAGTQTGTMRVYYK